MNNLAVPLPSVIHGPSSIELCFQWALQCLVCLASGLPLYETTCCTMDLTYPGTWVVGQS